MERKNRKQCSMAVQTTSTDQNSEDVRSSLKAEPSPSWLPPGSWLTPGSHAVRTKTKHSWKEKCMILREENKVLTEKVRKYENEHSRLKEISRDHASRLVQFDSSENVQIGNHNLQVVNNFGATFLNQLLDQYEDKIEKEARQRRLMRGQIQELSSKIEELTNTHKRSEQMSHCSKLNDHLCDLHQMTNQEKACPVSSIATIYKDTTEMFKSITPEILRLQESMTNLRTCIDEPKPVCLHACLSQRPLSILSLDERKLSENDKKFKCTREVYSELNLNMHV